MLRIKALATGPGFFCVFLCLLCPLYFWSMQDIRQWLASPKDYATGVALYEKYGSSSVRKRMFATGYSSFNMEKLEESLQELLPSPAPEPVAPKTVPKEAPAAPAKPAAAAPAPNPDDKALYEDLMLQRQEMLDTRTVAHARLSVVKTDAERLELALRILDLVPQIKKLNFIRKYYLQHACLPAESKPRPAVDESDKAALVQHRNNLRSKRSKLKSKPEKAQELQEVEEEIQRLTTLIDTL